VAAVKVLEEVHKGKYDYSNVEYINSSSKIVIRCPLHGEFTQTYASHQQGRGCPQCGRDKTATKGTVNQKVILDRFKGRHGDVYDYSSMVYTSGRTPVKIQCREHGDFLQTPNDHSRGAGCPLCKASKLSKSQLFTHADCLAKFMAAHNGRYNYSKVKYKRSTDKVTIICSKHGEFKQTPVSHWSGRGCASCSHSGASESELRFRAAVQSVYKGTIHCGDKTLLDKKELDLYLPEVQLGIEFDGTYWHSGDRVKSRRQHLDKFNEARSKGVRVLFIREDEWDNKPEIVLSIIRNATGGNSTKIYARKCEIMELGTKDYLAFCNENHLQGAVGASKKLGLYYEGNLVALAGFSKSSKYGYMLARFSVKLNTSVVGGLSKLMTAFGEPVYTYCDKRMFGGLGYLSAGFEVVEFGDTPDLWFTKQGKVLSRAAMTKPAMQKRWGILEEGTQESIAASHGWDAIRYCGNMLLKWYRPK